MSDPDPSEGADADAFRGSDGDGPSLEALAAELHRELEATEELPVERSASRWIGEAQAVAEDAAGDVPDEVVRLRAEQVEELLSNVETTGNEEANERIETARRRARAITKRFEDDR